MSTTPASATSIGRQITSLFRPALVVLGSMTLVTGIAYPIAMAGISSALFPYQARGSLTERNGHVIGSRLIGQSFADPRYFWGRPSATAPAPYNAAASTGSNLGPTNPALTDAVRTRVKALRAADPGNAQSVPVDLVTASGSGLDPDISIAAARYQIARVARARGISSAAIGKVVADNITGRQLGVLGEPRVNVLALNLALDASHPLRRAVREAGR